MSPTSCQTAPPRARRDKDYSWLMKTVSTMLHGKNMRQPLDFLKKLQISVRLCATRPNDLRPLVGFGANPACKFLRRVGDHVESLLPKGVARLLPPHSAHSFLVETRNDVARSASRREKTDPSERFELRVAELCHARDFRRQGAALQRGHGQRLHPAGAHLGQDGGNDRKHGLDISGKQISQRRREAAIRNVDHIELGVVLQKLHCQVRGTATSSGAVGPLARVLPTLLDERPEVVDSQIRLDYEHLGRRSEKRYRLQIPVRIIRKALVQILVHRDRPLYGHEERVTIRATLCNGFGADVPAGSGAIVDDERLP